MKMRSTFHVFKVEDQDNARWIEAVPTFTEARKLVKELMAKQRCGYVIFHESTGEKIRIMPDPEPPRNPSISQISPST
jgi:hypothetical protein